ALIEAGVTPCADAFVCVPGPHTFLRVPKSPGPAVVTALLGVVPVPVGGAELLRLHAPAMSTIASIPASKPNRFTFSPYARDLEVGEPARSRLRVQAIVTLPTARPLETALPAAFTEATRAESGLRRRSGDSRAARSRDCT